MTRLVSGVVIAALLAAVTCASSAAGSPRCILVIGDSISLGALPYVQEQLPCVEHAPGNSRDTAYILEHLSGWIGPYAGYVVNAGLWDMAHRNPSGDLGDVSQYPIVTQRWEYYANVDAILTRLQQTGAVVAWTTTTDVPADSIGIRPGDVPVFNDIARVLASYGHRVPVNDVGTVMLAHTDLHINQDGNRVHYNAAGYQLIAGVYVDTINRTMGGC